MAVKGRLWEELYLGQQVPDREIRRALTSAFDVHPEAVSIIDSFGNGSSPWAEPHTRIVVERVHEEGDFPLHLTVVLDAELKARVPTPDQTLDVVKRLCRLVESDCLVSGQDLDPYSWQLVRSTGEVEPVRVDPDALDEHNALVLAETGMARRATA